MSVNKILIIGFGSIGKKHAKNIKELGLGEVYVFDTRHITDSLGFPVILAPLDKVIRDFNVAFICTPPSTHLGLALMCAKAGLDCYIEKPLALNIENGEDLILLARKNKKTLMVGHLLQYHPVFVTLKELARGGDLGRINYTY